MIYTQKIKDAIRFSTKTHEVYQKQKRKGKDIPYITHPLTVGLILASAGAVEDVIVAGVLHDTIEDSPIAKKVTSPMLTERFGQNVVKLVLSVTEQNRELSWEDRKQEALEHVKSFSHESILLKSADIIANTSELIDDFRVEGVTTFERFNAPKGKIIGHYISMINAIMIKMPENPLFEDLTYVKRVLNSVLKAIESSISLESQHLIDSFNYDQLKEFIERGNSISDDQRKKCDELCERLNLPFPTE